MGYLNRLGYLDSPVKTSSQSLHDLTSRVPHDSEDTFKNALVKFQSKAGLPQTGQLGEATEGMMSKPRCGVSDFISASSEELARRIKRYAVFHWGNHIIP